MCAFGLSRYCLNRTRRPPLNGLSIILTVQTVHLWKIKTIDRTKWLFTAHVYLLFGSICPAGNIQDLNQYYIIIIYASLHYAYMWLLEHPYTSVHIRRYFFCHSTVFRHYYFFFMFFLLFCFRLSLSLSFDIPLSVFLPSLPPTSTPDKVFYDDANKGSATKDLFAVYRHPVMV